MDSAAFSSLVASRHSVRDSPSDLIASDVLDSTLGDVSNVPSWSNARLYMLALANGEQADRLRSAYVEAWRRWLAQMAKDKNASANGLTEGLPDGNYKGWRPYPDELRARSVDLGKKLYGHLDTGREDHERCNTLSRRNYEAFGASVIGFVPVREDFMLWAAMDASLMFQTLLLLTKIHGVDQCLLGLLSLWRSSVDAEFDVPEGYRLLAGFALSHTSDAHINSFAAPRLKIGFIASKKQCFALLAFSA